MAGNGSKQKKSLMSHASEMLQKTCSKIRKSDKGSKTENSLTSESADSFDSSNNFATWPLTNLRAIIEEKVNSYLGPDDPKRVNIIDEVECELNSEFPTEMEEQLDFCMMCSEADHEEAIELQKHLCSEYDLVGKVVWECIPIGRDLFSAVEDVIRKSTRLLYYISERFDDTDVCAYVARNLLMEQESKGANRKIIPLVTEFDTPIPETFELIDKLYLCSKLQFQFRFPAVFTEEVRLEKVVRDETLQIKLDNKRKKIIQILVQRKLAPKSIID